MEEPSRVKTTHYKGKRSKLELNDWTLKNGMQREKRGP
jgi:hypothetical protein